ncbi:MAG: hypothetical protein LVR00_07210 [Rhabdochlamydiaceae bacterium]
MNSFFPIVHSVPWGSPYAQNELDGFGMGAAIFSEKDLKAEELCLKKVK